MKNKNKYLPPSGYGLSGPSYRRDQWMRRSIPYRRRRHWQVAMSAADTLTHLLLKAKPLFMSRLANAHLHESHKIEWRIRSTYNKREDGTFCFAELLADTVCRHRSSCRSVERRTSIFQINKDSHWIRKPLFLFLSMEFMLLEKVGFFLGFRRPNGPDRQTAAN